MDREHMFGTEFERQLAILGDPASEELVTEHDFEVSNFVRRIETITPIPEIMHSVFREAGIDVPQHYIDARYKAYEEQTKDLSPTEVEFFAGESLPADATIHSVLKTFKDYMEELRGTFIYEDLLQRTRRFGLFVVEEAFLAIPATHADLQQPA